VTAHVPAKQTGRFFERRSEERFAVELPGTVVFGEASYPVRVLSVARGGAMFVTTETMKVSSRLILRCGALASTATVEWHAEGHVGVRFARLLSDRELAEQRSRSNAIRSLREQSRSSRSIRSI
jgi:hypothetical protein